MKEKLKELGCWIEDRLRVLYGKLSIDQKITFGLVMLLGFAALNLYISISSIYNWGKENEKKQQIKIEHLRRLEPEREKPDYREFIDSEVERRLFERYREDMERDSLENKYLQKQQRNEYEKRNKNKFRSETKA